MSTNTYTVPCIGEVWELELGGKLHLVLILSTKNRQRDEGKVILVHYLILKGNGEGRKDWHRLEEMNQWRWVKVAD